MEERSSREIEREIEFLKLDPVLRRLAVRMAHGVDPALVAELWTGTDEPIEWLVEQVYWYQWYHGSNRRSNLEYKDSAARAVIAVYKEKREQLDRCSRLCVAGWCHFRSL